MSFGLLYLKGLFVLGLLVLVNNKLAYVLHFDKLHDSVCEDNSWIDRKCWQRFLSNICKSLFFKQIFTFLLVNLSRNFYPKVYYIPLYHGRI